ALTPYLLDSEQGYVSFLSVLHRNDIISQIPSTIQIATTGRGRTVESEVGTFEFIQISPQLMLDGFYMWGDKVTYNIATSEKALFDCLYISTRKNNRFSHFPELDLKNVSKNKVLKFTNQLIKSKSIRNAVIQRINRLGL